MNTQTSGYCTFYPHERELRLIQLTPYLPELTYHRYKYCCAVYQQHNRDQDSGIYGNIR
ncbi:hypothetical protein GBAR_LOCUS13615 [Geodia barretti]|uniref:Uncharacterized protein n=1 Tax=Geodia barretti TaxID=519541 RepID=A0AA35S7G4_GEOBA|nr:hypothetical protein GBAR_LOCUS13615 [Geodia barretti]